MNIEDLREYMMISVEASVIRTTADIEEFAGLMEATGVSDINILKELKTDLKDKGRIFGAFSNKSKSIMANGVESAGDIAVGNVYADAGVKHLLWVTAGGNVCPDCDNREGVTGTAEYFQLIGEPKSGFSVCREHCQCELVPVEYSNEGTKIIKEKK